MEKKKSYLFTMVFALATIVLLLSYVLCYTVNVNTANAQVEEAETRGVMTKISITLGCSDGSNVWADAHNDFTLGLSTVSVYVELYSSLDYQESVDNMQLESSNYQEDLDMYKTLTTTAPINGVKRYWRARVKFKQDNKDWQSKETATYLVDVDGRLII